jgi:hypothetical protein
MPFTRVECGRLPAEHRAIVFKAFPKFAPKPVIKPAQKVLPLRLPEYSLSDLALEVLTIVTRLADARISMPSYPVLAEMASNRTRQSVAKAFDRLVNLGFCRVEFRSRERRVLIVATGQITGWGAFIAGPAPFGGRKRIPTQAAALRRGKAPLAAGNAVQLPTAPAPGAPTPVVFEEPATCFATQPAARFLAEPIGPSRKCQFPIAQVPGGRQWVFCEAHSMPGKSWCAEHFDVVYVRK